MNRFLIEREGAKVKVVLTGELTLAVATELRELLCAIEEDGVLELVLDCAKTTVLDTAGLSVLLAARNSFLQAPKSLCLTSVTPPLFSLLESLRLEQRLNVRME